MRSIAGPRRVNGALPNAAYIHAVRVAGPHSLQGETERGDGLLKARQNGRWPYQLPGGPQWSCLISSELFCRISTDTEAGLSMQRRGACRRGGE